MVPFVFQYFTKQNLELLLNLMFGTLWSLRVKLMRTARSIAIELGTILVLTLGIPDSSCSMICVLRAILALNRVGSARASSNELV